MLPARPLSVLLIALFLSAGLIGLYSCSKEGQETTAAGPRIHWLTNFEQGMDQAREKNRPVMIDFFTDWCGWCKTLDNTTYADAAVAKKAEQFISLKIDADGQRSLAARYKVGAFPTILFIDTEGREIHRVIGFRPPGDFVREMDIALNAFNR
jgi:thiol:disulfide interchange protein